MHFEHDDALRSNIRRARIVKVDDSGTQQLVDLRGLKNEEPRKIFRPQPHGFTSNPPPDSEGVLFGMGGRSDRALYFDGGHKDYRPKNTPQGGTVVYDHAGNIVSIVQQNLRIVHSTEIHLIAPTIILEGTVKLGGPDAARPASAQGTTDTHGDADSGNFATKVLLK